MQLFSTILNINKKMTKEAFIRMVIKWNQDSRYAENIIPDIQWNGERNVRYGGENLWLAIEEYRNQNIIAVRYEKKEGDGVIWDTDYVMNFNSMKMSVRLERSFTVDALDADSKFSSPQFIALLIQEGYLEKDHKLPLLDKATMVNTDNIGLITDIINGKTCYNLPVVYVSKTNTNENPVDISKLAYRLKGVAHVMVEESTELDQEIKNQCDGNNEYHGAIGIYYPSQGNRHRRYLYRRDSGYDSFLLERVTNSVIQYCSAQMVDTLFTWQGVNNALLRDRLISQREKRFTAEKAQREAEAEATKLLDTLDEEERNIREKALEDAQSEANAILEAFDKDMQKLQEQIETLTRDNESLQFENQGLRAKLNSKDTVPILCMGNESDFYEGEVKDLLLATFSEAVKGLTSPSRRADVINDIINTNDYQEMSVKKAERVKNLLKNYDGMTAKIRQELKELGFDITEDGKHYKVTYYGDNRYQTVYSKTPSDGRSGKNSAQNTINMAF